MKALVLLLSLCWVCWCKPTTVVNFSPVGDTPGIAPGFAYAFRALYKPTSVYTGAHPILTNHLSDQDKTPTIFKTQYHSQDQLGQYIFGYVGAASTAHEVRTLDGSVRGSYTYLDGNGELQTANYVADNNGFRVEATNLPLAPDAPVMVLPEPVKLTPEVEAATAAHLKAVAEIRAARARSKRSAPSKGYQPPPPPPPVKRDAPIKKVLPGPAPIKKVLPGPAPIKKVLPGPAPLKVSHVPVPLTAPSAVILSPHPSPINVLLDPFPFHAGATQAVFVKADLKELQPLSPVPVGHPAVVPASKAIIAPVAPAPVWIAPSHILSQFHAQDELGGYEYGYEGGPSSKHEVQTPDGVTRGSYSYIDANGELQTVSYIADDVFGFRVLATNLPEAPADPY